MRISDWSSYVCASDLNVTMTSDLGMSLLVRTTGPPEPHVDMVRSAVHRVNPNLSIFNVKTMARVVADSMWKLNLYRWKIGRELGRESVCPLVYISVDAALFKQKKSPTTES